MKSIIAKPTVQLDNYEQQDRLEQQTRFTENGQKRNFTTVDLWNRNRKVRSASSKVRRWYLN